ncbi:MAG: hypothetical protein HY831_01805 [Candidatus Aenigmarchaeota archaeon]|nr:hypothetical protein [Candidatus Aenigmarchaeota archaeon]
MLEFSWKNVAATATLHLGAHYAAFSEAANSALAPYVSAEILPVALLGATAVHLGYEANRSFNDYLRSQGLLE